MPPSTASTVAAAWALAFVAVLAVPASRAGTQEDPEVTDAAGDVAFQSVPVPLGLEWADVTAAWFTHEGGNVTLAILTRGQPPVQGEVGVTFAAGDEHYIAGFTVVPGLYAGGFLSRSDANGDVPGDAQPEGRPATWSSGRIEVTFAVEDVGAPAELGDPWAWSESEASNGEAYRLDRTAVGRAFRLQAPEALGEPPAGSQAASSEHPVPVPALAPVAGMLVAAWARSRCPSQRP